MIKRKLLARAQMGRPIHLLEENCPNFWCFSQCPCPIVEYTIRTIGSINTTTYDTNTTQFSGENCESYDFSMKIYGEILVYLCIDISSAIIDELEYHFCLSCLQILQGNQMAVRVKPLFNSGSFLFHSLACDNTAFFFLLCRYSRFWVSQGY